MITHAVWELTFHSVGSWKPGTSFAPRCCIGKLLFRAMTTHGSTGLTANQLGFTHGAAASLPPEFEIHFGRDSFRPSDWTALTAVDASAVYSSGQPVIPEMLDVLMSPSVFATAANPHPEAQAWADAFAQAPSNATW